MIILNYVRRCKKNTGSATHARLHAADNQSTACGKELNEMWFIESSAGLSVHDITCPTCRKILKLR